MSDPDSPSSANVADHPISTIVAAVRGSGKYGHISDALLQRVASEEIAKRRNAKEAIKATKNKLHQVGGAYQGEMRYAKWLQALMAAPDAPTVSPLSSPLLQSILAQHASTRERLPLLGSFYQRIFAVLSTPIHSVLDVACGLNPLCLPWMPLSNTVRYRAYDIYGDMMAFINQCLAHWGYPQAQAAVCDVLSAVSAEASPLSESVDLALVLKTIPCLEQIDKTIGPKLLDTLRARYIVVSFPAQSLGGRNKNMAANYAAHFETLVAGRPWRIQRLDFATELVFVIDTAG